MPNQMDYFNFGLYLLKRVIVTFADGRSACGVLNSFSPESSEIVLDDTPYPIGEITDMEMTGSVTYHTYAADSGSACDIDGLYFGLEDFVAGTDYSRILYGEFDCIAACHLAFDESKIAAKEIRILSFSHRVYLPALTKTSHLYLFYDGTAAVGTLQVDSVGASLCGADGTVTPISLDRVQDIIRLPLTNESVEITFRDGSAASGVVSAANDSIIVLLGDSLRTVRLADVLSIRYRGTVSAGTVKLSSGAVRQIKLSLGVKDEAFLCKLPYFRSREDEDRAVDGAAASFVPGITDRGLIAKDVAVEAGEESGPGGEASETGIIVITPTASRTVGYIGSEFTTRTYSLMTHSGMPRGSVAFSAEQLSFRISPRSIYVVRYQCSHQESLPKARNIELVETLPLSDYAKVWIDASGAVQKLPVSVLFLDKFLNQTVDISTEDGQQLSGVLVDVRGDEITLSNQAGNTPVRTERILRVFYCGTVTAYQSSNGTGFINGQYWFHVNNFVDRNQILRLQVGVSVRFTFEVSNKGNLCAATAIEFADTSVKQGYVLKYLAKCPGKGYGFIIEPELLESRLSKNERSGSIFFRESDIENPGMFQVDTKRCYYLVTYTEGDGNTARNVRFLEEHPFKSKSASAHRTEVRAVSELAGPSDALASADFEYGFINLFGSKHAFINPQFYNKDYMPDVTYDISQRVYFDPTKATITPDPHLKTAKHTYLVRYVRKGHVTDPTTGQEQSALDYSYPIEVICAFPRKQCASILLDGGNVTVEYVDEAQPEPSATAPLSEDSAPAFMLGESLYFKLKDNRVCYGLYAGESEDAYALSNGTAIGKDTVSRLFRFGVITSLNLEKGTATINNSFEFHLGVAEPQMLSILRNQRNLVQLHIMYSSTEGRITEVCRVSRRCQSCLPWDPGVVTEFDSRARFLTIDSSITHYLTVMSEGVNPYVNNGTILNRPVFVKQVFHPFVKVNAAQPGIVAMAVDVRCQEEELRIQYDDGKDTYFGYRNATVFFPVFGSSRFLHDRIGETVLVSFRVSSDTTSLEGYLEDDAADGPEGASPETEADASGIRQESLSLLLLQREDADQFLSGKFHRGPDGNLSDPDQAQRAVDFLISQSKHLSAVKIALKYPESDLLPNADSLLQSEMRTRCTTVSLDANSCYGEQAYYLTTLLRYPAPAKPRANRAAGGRYSSYDCLYRLFSQDFEDREHLVRYIQEGRPATRSSLMGLFSRPCPQTSEFVSHLVLLDRVSMDIVCLAIRSKPQLCEEVLSYAKDIDDTISSDNASEVLRALQERYQRDKRRFSDRIHALIGAAHVCDALKEILTHMQSRFLRLICRDDCLRFERLLKICTDVLDYTNKAGFSQQEQLLQSAYRDVGLLEEEILAHPCRESAEILLGAGHADLSDSILAAVRRDIFQLLNQLYQGASAPRIRCEVNETAIRPDAKTFWLLIRNGDQNENLQAAENLRIELESFTDGFLPQRKVSLAKTRLPCGEQLAAEVEFELSGGATGALEFGWTARYECAAEFLSSGSTRRSAFQQESERPLQLQIDATSADTKNYHAENPYADPARGQPLVGRKMFFGREQEKRKILDSFCVTEGEKRFIPGSAVIIHGQKKSGKTSLVNQIKNYIQEDPVLSDRAIFLNFSNILSETGGVQQLPYFQRTFYAAIMSRFRHEIKLCHPDVSQLLLDSGMAIPNLLSPDFRDTWPAVFESFFQDLASIDGGRHSIILFMDEFTLLCTTILSEVRRFPEKAFLSDIPNFIQTFSQYGFIQIIIGHESMMRALDTLGVLNHTAEFAKSIEISALDDAASQALVTQPMQASFGYDVYRTELGAQAVDRLLDLSGRNPAYLMRLCNQMFLYYTDPKKCPRTQLLLSDVNAMVQEYTGELLLSDFEILLREDGDDTKEAEERITYHYLKCAALLSLASYDRRTADSGEITRELTRSFGYTIAEVEKTRNTLEARRVISITNGGRVKINTGLFSEYIQQKNGLR